MQPAPPAAWRAARKAWQDEAIIASRRLIAERMEIFAAEETTRWGGAS